jgi:hypothetical protein
MSLLRVAADIGERQDDDREARRDGFFRHSRSHGFRGLADFERISADRISGAFVIGRSTAFTYKGKAVDLKQIGRELNVRYVLEGSVQRGGGRMRVNVQLIDAEIGNHVWAERFEKPLADLLDIEDRAPRRARKSYALESGTQASCPCWSKPFPENRGPLSLGLALAPRGVPLRP